MRASSRADPRQPGCGKPIVLFAGDAAAQFPCGEPPGPSSGNAAVHIDGQLVGFGYDVPAKQTVQTDRAGQAGRILANVRLAEYLGIETALD